MKTDTALEALKKFVKKYKLTTKTYKTKKGVYFLEVYVNDCMADKLYTGPTNCSDEETSTSYSVLGVDKVVEFLYMKFGVKNNKNLKIEKTWDVDSINCSVLDTLPFLIAFYASPAFCSRPIEKDTVREFMSYVIAYIKETYNVSKIRLTMGKLESCTNTTTVSIRFNIPIIIDPGTIFHRVTGPALPRSSNNLFITKPPKCYTVVKNISKSPLDCDYIITIDEVLIDGEHETGVILHKRFGYVTAITITGNDYDMISISKKDSEWLSSKFDLDNDNAIALKFLGRFELKSPEDVIDFLKDKIK